MYITVLFLHLHLCSSLYIFMPALYLLLQITFLSLQGFVFREDRAALLMRDMISAVHYLHSKGIVHRDLKLENFLFEAKQSNSPLVLIDFGLSKYFEPDERMNQRVGSCYYTAPEVLTGSYDYKCDVWSLGVLCYMLLSGSPPFYGKSVDDVYNATLTQEPTFPEKKFR